MFNWRKHGDDGDCYDEEKGRLLWSGNSSDSSPPLSPRLSPRTSFYKAYKPHRGRSTRVYFVLLIVLIVSLLGTVISLVTANVSLSDLEARLRRISVKSKHRTWDSRHGV